MTKAKEKEYPRMSLHDGFLANAIVNKSRKKEVRLGAEGLIRVMALGFDEDEKSKVSGKIILKENSLEIMSAYLLFIEYMKHKYPLLNKYHEKNISLYFKSNLFDLLMNPMDVDFWSWLQDFIINGHGKQFYLDHMGEKDFGI